MAKTNWVCGSETRYRNESRFKQKRFDDDLGLANAKVAAKQKILSDKCLSVNRALNDAQYKLGKLNQAEAEQSVLKQTVKSHKQKLSIVNSSSYAVDYKLNYVKSKLSGVKCKESKLGQEIRNLPGQIAATKRVAESDEKESAVIERILLPSILYPVTSV